MRTRNMLGLIAVVSMLAACKSEQTMDNGETAKCVGLNGHESPRYEYEYSARNIAVGIIFVEAIVPPIVVALDELKCPVGPALPRDPHA